MNINIIFDEVVAETDTSWLLSFGHDKAWLPKSEVEIKEASHYRYAIIPPWLVRENSLEDYEIEV